MEARMETFRTLLTFFSPFGKTKSVRVKIVATANIVCIAGIVGMSVAALLR
jgi:hypothetical protein